MELWVRTAADFLHERENLGDDWIYSTHKRSADKTSWNFCFKTRGRIPQTLVLNITQPELRQLEGVAT
jgi:hypothetical protein